MEEEPLLLDDEDGGGIAETSFQGVPPNITEDDFKDFEVGMAVSRYDGKGGRQRVNCCQGLMKDCLELIDAEASTVLESEDIEDIDISALNMVVCRETLDVRNEMEVYNALLRWSGRECKRQKLEMTNANRRKVLEGCQYLVRYLTMSQEEFLRASGLLTLEEQDALLVIIAQGDSVSIANEEPLPDHLIGMRTIMRTKRKGRPTGASKKKFSTRIKGRNKNKDSAAKVDKIVEQQRKMQLRSAVSQETSNNKEKFNIIEEFFICLACIFD